MTQTSEKWITDLKELKSTFRKEFGHLSIEEMNTKPSPGAWSIAQVIDHIIEVNESYFPTFELVRKGKYVHSILGNFAFIRRFFGRMILKSVLPESKKKYKTLPLWQPSQTDLHENMVARFEKHQAALMAELEATETFIRRNVTIASPANDMIVYDIQTALDIIVNHEKRHLLQALHVKSGLQSYK
ncbi:MAG: DinB family protein [Saprospiraceae bacterium]|nr:DinB family protein [Saprospiraceae bacterium]